MLTNFITQNAGSTISKWNSIVIRAARVEINPAGDVEGADGKS